MYILLVCYSLAQCRERTHKYPSLGGLAGGNRQRNYEWQCSGENPTHVDAAFRVSDLANAIHVNGICPARRLEPKVHGRILNEQASGQHLGLHPVLKFLDFLQDRLCQRTGMVHGHTLFVTDRNMITHPLVINMKRRMVEVLAFSHVVNKVKNHPCGLDVRKSNDPVDRAVWTCCNEERRDVGS